MKRLVLLVAALVFALCTSGMAGTVNVDKAPSTKGSAEMKPANKPDINEQALKRNAEIEKARKEKAEKAYDVKSGKQSTTSGTGSTSSSSTGSTSSSSKGSTSTGKGGAKYDAKCPPNSGDKMCYDKK